MSGSGFKSFTAGAKLLASEVNGYLMKQSIMYFATEAARDAAVTSPEEGMHAYLADSDSVTYYSGSAWRCKLDEQSVVKRVRVATTANGTLATAFENGDTIDGVVLATGDRILLKDQSTGADNGIRVVAASGAPARATDFDASSEVLPNTLVIVSEGTANADTMWQLTTNAPITVGSTALVFAQFGAGGGFVSGELAYAQVTANQASIGTSATDLTSLSVSPTVTDDPIIVVGSINAAQGASNAIVVLEIYDNTAAAIVQSRNVYLPSGQDSVLTAIVRLDPGAGARTYKLRASVQAGTFTMGASATAPAFIHVFKA